MYGTQQKIPSEGGSETLYTQQSFVCMEEKTSWCVFCTYQKRSLYEEKGIWEIKEKASGKVDQVLCLGGEKDSQKI